MYLNSVSIVQRGIEIYRKQTISKYSIKQKFSKYMFVNRSSKNQNVDF